MANAILSDLEIQGASATSGLRVTSFVDGSGTPGNATANTLRGRHAIAGAASTCVVTNSCVTAASQVVVTLETNDGTLTFVKTAIPAAGSFTVTGNAAATGTTKFSWIVIN